MRRRDPLDATDKLRCYQTSFRGVDLSENLELAVARFHGSIGALDRKHAHRNTRRGRLDCRCPAPALEMLVAPRRRSAYRARRPRPPTRPAEPSSLAAP